MIKFIDEYRDKDVAQVLARRVRETADRPMRLMEICGTHTMAIYQYGIRSLLPPAVRLISGPGCPVCVTPNGYLDRAIAYSRLPETIIATFGGTRTTAVAFGTVYLLGIIFTYFMPETNGQGLPDA